jgi:L-malate glycosyltransferase
MTPLHVGHVTLTMEQGGIENLIISLGKNAAREQMKCSVYCLDGGGELTETAERLGMQLRLFRRRPGMDWRLILSLARGFRADNLHVVHTHNEAANFYGCLAARLAGTPVVINTEHSRHYIDERWQRRIEKRFLALLTDRLVAVSAELRRCSLYTDRINPEKLAVIVNGVDQDRFTSVRPGAAAEFRSREGISPRAMVVTIVARLHPVKNHPLLFRAIKLLAGKLPDLRLVVVGDGEEKAALELLVDNLGLAGVIKFLGSRRDVPVILKASNMLVLCSSTEGLPLILLEAMTAGIPVVVTKGANSSGLVRHGINGLVSGDTAEELALAITALYEADPSNADMTAAAYELATSCYSLDRMSDEYGRLYRQCLSRRC